MEYSKAASRASSVEQSKRIFVLTFSGPAHVCYPRDKWYPKGQLGPRYIGGGGDTLICAHCEFAIADAVNIEALSGKELRCPRCNCPNIVPQIP